MILSIACPAVIDVGVGLVRLAVVRIANAYQLSKISDLPDSGIVTFLLFIFFFLFEKLLEKGLNFRLCR